MIENLKRRLSSPTKTVTRFHFEDENQPLQLQLDDVQAVYDGKWHTLTGSSAEQSKQITELLERNRSLQEENHLLKFKLDVLLDQLAISKLDSLQLQQELRR